MEEGFIIDHSHTAATVAKWVAGKPEKSFWTGIKRGGEQVDIEAHRCVKCGYIELYSR